MRLSIRIRGLLWLVFAAPFMVFCCAFVAITGLVEWVRFGDDDGNFKGYLHYTFVKPYRMLIRGEE